MTDLLSDEALQQPQRWLSLK